MSQAPMNPGIGYHPNTVPTGVRYSSFLQKYYPGWQGQYSQTGGPNLPAPGSSIGPGQPGHSDVGGSPRDQLNSANPNAITSSEAFQRLLTISRGGSQAPATLDRYLKPGFDFASAGLASTDPTGIKGLVKNVGQQTYERGEGSLRGAISDATREGQNALGPNSNPAMAGFMNMMSRVKGAGSLNELRGQSNSAQTQADIGAADVTSTFQRGLLDVMGQYGNAAASTQLGAEGNQFNAASSAAQIQAQAMTSWADILARLAGGAYSSNTYQQPTGDFEQWLTRRKQTYYAENGTDAQDARWIDDAINGINANQAPARPAPATSGGSYEEWDGSTIPVS